MKKNIEFDFNLGDKVLLKEVQRPGRVDCLQFDNYGAMYRCCYWDGAERKVVWLYPDEIELRTA